MFSSKYASGQAAETRVLAVLILGCKLHVWLTLQKWLGFQVMGNPRLPCSQWMLQGVSSSENQVAPV